MPEVPVNHRHVLDVVAGQQLVIAVRQDRPFPIVTPERTNGGSVAPERDEQVPIANRARRDVPEEAVPAGDEANRLRDQPVGELLIAPR